MEDATTTPTRVRRTNTKLVNYAKEQEFSDAEADVFEDQPSDDEPFPHRSLKRSGGGGGRTKASSSLRKSNSTTGGGTGRSSGTAAVTAAVEHSSYTPAVHHGDSTTDQPYSNNNSHHHHERPVYSEKNYDSNLPPIRERFPFLPEYEEDGSPKIELIVGRRPVDENEEKPTISDHDDSDEENDQTNGNSKRRSRSAPSTPVVKKRGGAKKQSNSDDEDDNEQETVKSRKRKGQGESKSDETINDHITEYEYLVKYKGRSYLHLEWKTGADLESMNKSAKGIYRRYLKKLAAPGTADTEELESPEVEASFVVPEKIVDEADQEIAIELSDAELLQWEQQQQEEENDDEDATPKKSTASPASATPVKLKKEIHKKKEAPGIDANDWPDGMDYKTVPLEHLRHLLSKEEPFYPVVEGSDNPYRDGYVTEPPKKPRASYLFFQATVRSYFVKEKPNAPQSELMSLLGEAWRSLTEPDKERFQLLADEEAKQYAREKVLLEKAQKPNGVWQPLRRCRHVLERLAKDSFADIFLEPVDLADFPDYEDVIDIMMDLGTVRQRLETKKYQAPEQFARDMRRIWNNCKIYNQHGSAIWHVADYMSKQYERLYHAWVLEFRERYLRWADPRARPWEHSCRVHDGKCDTPDDCMIMCDHCDGAYGIHCLTPPISTVPTRAWHCPDCKPKLKSAKGVRMLSAVAEHAAQKRAELGDLPKKKITQTMFLVKWAGLGYEFCTWETKDDVGNDALIAEFHKLNSAGFADEADMPAEMIDEFLHEIKHVNHKNAGGANATLSFLRSQFYAQNRGLEFLRYGIDLPDNLSCEMGPKVTAVHRCPRVALPCEQLDMTLQHSYPREVAECVADIVFRVAGGLKARTTRSHTLLPPPLTGEYDVILPITSKGLMMNVGETAGAVAFLGYRQFPDGSKGPAEEAGLIRYVGDKILAVDGISTVGKSFHDVINMLRESGNSKFAYMRFLENQYAMCECTLVSSGSKGRYAFDELQKKFITDRQRMVVLRKTHIINDEPDLPDDEFDGTKKAEDSDDDSEAGSEGSFSPDSEDEELVGTVPTNEVSQDENGAIKEVKVTSGIVTDSKDGVLKSELDGNENGTPHALMSSISTPMGESDVTTGTPTVSPTQMVLCREETTRSLGTRLLDVDLGYSSDEAGDEDCVYFVDGVDRTFESVHDLYDVAPKKSSSKGKGAALGDTLKDGVIPACKSEFLALGEKAKLAAAVTLSTTAPSIENFEHYPDLEKDEATISPLKSTKRSTVKVEQVNTATGETIHIWANAEAVAATLQFPLASLRQVLRGEYDEDIGEEVGGFRWRFAPAGAKVTAGNANQSRGGGGKKAKEAWLEFRDKLYDPSEPHIYKNGNRLRDYQVDGVNWLASMWYKRQGCILADEMGLGKTVQIVCYIEHVFRVEKIRRPFLVVVPLSTVEHWRREFEGWTDMICCVYHDRQRIWRDVMREYEWYYEDRPHTAEFLKFDVLVTTYDTLIGDFDIISQIPFRIAVVDEAHRLRNQKGKLLECMREISARGTMQYGFQSRVLMSGTPLQNDLTELWTLLNFIEPFKFPDLESFQVNFGNMANRGQVEALQNMISPFMLRRVKEDVAKDIPAKEETVIDVEMTSFQKQYYRAIFEHNHAFLNIGATRQTAPKLMNIQMELRKVCNHPFLLEGVEHRETDRMYKEFLESGAFDGKTPEEQQQMLNAHGYIMTSGKMVLLDKLLPKLRQEGHKILIFSQMVKMLDLISEYCEFRDFRYERLDGRIRGSERQKAIDRFEREDDSFLFLLSTRAGGVGINLVSATVCILFDSDWNPQNDVQAQARCHRIGQTKDVRVYRLVTSRSFEQEMFDRASKKLGLEQAVLGTFEKEFDDDKPTQQEMEQLLKRGAYALLDDDNDDETKQFCADDIDSILAKRTRTRVVEGTKSASWLNKQGMVVSKSKFTSETGETLDMDDPLFWQKVMPDFVTPSMMLQKLRDLEDEIEGKVRGPGRGRGRWKKKKTDDAPAAAISDKPDGKDDQPVEGNSDSGEMDVEKPAAKDDVVESDEDAENVDADFNHAEAVNDESSDDGKKKNPLKKLSRNNIRKISKFMSDLKSMMQSTFEDDEEDALTAQEKDACQKLLLTVSVKDKIFNEEYRLVAKKFLKRFEGDRRRRCRTSEQPRFRPDPKEEEPSVGIREELMITGKRKGKKRQKRPTADLDDPVINKNRTTDNAGGYVGEDGYLHHSDSEDDWSDVGPDIYQASDKKDVISRSEANRRRTWTADDDAATAAGRAWPVFPRPLVRKVLATVLDKVIAYDEEKGGVFSVPVPKDEFPEYYQQIKKPMDYGTMRIKLEDGEYRSAQSMQKDFILIMQNCRTFNADSSDIVREARAQHLKRPKFLKEAAADHNLFLAEDGTVLEIVDKPGSAKKKAKQDGGSENGGGDNTKKGARNVKIVATESDVEDTDTATKSKKSHKKAKTKPKGSNDDDHSTDKKKPRIKIKLQGDGVVDDTEDVRSKSAAMERNAPTKRKREETGSGDDEGLDPTLKKRKKSSDTSAKQKKSKVKASTAPESTDDSRPLQDLAARKTRIGSEGDAKSLYLDIQFWKKCREGLNGTYKAARKNLTQHDGWELPSSIPDGKFAEIALYTLDKMKKHDRYSIFEEEVSDKEAPGYSDVVTIPMDFGKMREKIKSGEYGTGSEAANSFYKDFRQVFDNCYLYNDEGNEVTEEAVRVLGYLPETYASACIHFAQKQS